MKLGFEEAQSRYDSGSQNARAWTEDWVGRWLYCPNCGADRLSHFEANRPVADFFCPACQEQYELKSQKSAFGMRVVDGALRTMLERLTSDANPNLLLMRYDLAGRAVTDLCIIPKHFFVREVIEPRKPLAPTARRAGWTGCNIRLDRIPDAGRIYIVRNGLLAPKEGVVDQWRQTLFLRDESVDARGWLIEVMRCVERIGRPEFTLEDVYAFEPHLAALYPGNRHVREKVRQQLQVLRDHGYLDFVSRGF